MKFWSATESFFSSECSSAVSAPPAETLLLKKGERAGLTVRLELPERAEAPLAQGQPLGFAVVMSGEEELGRWPVQAGEAVPQLDFGRCFRRLARAALKL